MMKYLSLLFMLLILSCAGTKETTTPTQETIVSPKYDESFDPLTLNDDDIIIDPGKKTTESPQKTEQINQTASDNKRKEVNGFRVQILATSNIETASLTEQEATDRFEKGGHQTYLLFEAPLYKVRIGDCLQRNEAEELRELALSYGYSGAFIVKTRVITGK